MMLTVPQLHRQTEVLRDKLSIVLEQWQDLCGDTHNHVATVLITEGPSVVTTATGIEPDVIGVGGDNSRDDVEDSRIEHGVALINESINAIASDISDRLLPAAAKYISKADYQDPVTGLKRYGDSTKLKLLSARDTLIDLHSKCETIRSDVHVFMTDRGITGTTLSSSSSASKGNSTSGTISIGHRSGVLLNLDSDFQFIDKSKVQVTAVTSSMNGIATVIDDATVGGDMEEKVRLIKLRRAKELEEQMQLQAMLHSKLLSVVSYYNNYRGNLITSSSTGDSSKDDVLKIGLDRFIHCNSSGGSGGGGRLIETEDSRRLISTALKTVLNIVTNIISKPDQINIRKLRINHSALRDSLTGMEGGIEVLLLLGFEAQLLDSTMEEKAGIVKGGGGGGRGGDSVSSTPQSMTTMTMLQRESTIDNNSYPVSGKVLEIINQYECSDNDNGLALPLPSYSSIFSIISPHTKWQLHLEMTEPPIDDIVSKAITIPNNNNSSSSSSSSGGATPDGPSQLAALLDTKLSWIDWYDRLTHHRSVIEVVLKDYLHTTSTTADV